MNQFVKQSKNSGEGLMWCTSFNSWKVGIKNHKVENSLKNFELLERHFETDEVFILLSGRCFLIVGDSEQLESQEMEVIDMEPNSIYTMKQGVWHNMVTFDDTKLVLVEEKKTSLENSEVKPLPDIKRERIKEHINSIL
ncbi:cupin domain-containing protein [Grimontia hollisae]|uniref:cupin domain-containing protein n=1 Tax=Grimontia hollisae TaxID=673 RepID=UPI0023DC0463|nr:cupin domain-containing protein [Grimontia hollisae]MDF2183984.1 cupin domain-containing protein [Grimontia hollisae]